jgi:hypothetical protein
MPTSTQRSNEPDPTLRPDNAQDEADEDLRAYRLRREMGLEEIPAAPSSKGD